MKRCVAGNGFSLWSGRARAEFPTLCARRKECTGKKKRKMLCATHEKGSVAYRSGDINPAGHLALHVFGIEAAAVSDFAMGAEKHLSEIAEYGCLTNRDAILRGRAKDGGENVEDVFGTLQGASGLVKFGADGLSVGFFVAAVEAAVAGVEGSDGHATASLIDGREGAAGSIGKSDGWGAIRV
jgi:hypothetical protein